MPQLEADNPKFGLDPGSRVDDVVVRATIGGDRWISCGHAALAFDPICGQGVFSALYGGMTVG